MKSVTLKIKKCQQCPFFQEEDEAIDIYHGCAYSYYPPRCTKKDKELPKELKEIPSWCPLN